MSIEESFRNLLREIVTEVLHDIGFGKTPEGTPAESTSPEPAPDKPRRGRPRLQHAENAAPAPAAPVAPVAQAPATAPTPVQQPAPASNPGEITDPFIKEFVKIKSRDDAKAVLRKFGVERASMIKEKDRPAALKEIQAVLNNQESLV